MKSDFDVWINEVGLFDDEDIYCLDINEVIVELYKIFKFK